jgi:pilus assembly protein CpaC
MKNILLLSVVTILINLPVFAKELIAIELGQDHLLTKKFSKVWIENPTLISAQPKGSQVYLKALGIGRTQIRLDNESYTVVSTPIGSLKTFTDWTLLSKKFLGLQVDFCEDVVCLKGKLYRYTDFEKILQLIQMHGSALYWAVDADDILKKKISAYSEKFLRDKGLTPLKLMYGQPWRIQYTSKDFASDYKKSMQLLGILAVENKQKIEVADNVRVAVQITEVKKEFGRAIGIKWPGTYSAQILDGEATKILPIDVSAIANENEGQVKVLASPTLICRSGKEAEFFAGGEFPIRILNFKVNDVVWKKYGIGMKIKPVIDSIGQMSIQIESEVSSLDKSVSVDGIPGIHTHRVLSHFDLIKSQTIALSGLLKNETGDSSEGVPFLKQIPILGHLFSSQDYRESKTELVIFVTPELMKQEGDATP